VKRGFVAALGAVAIVVGGLAGCSSDKSAEESVSSATESAKTAVSEATETAKSAATSATDAAKAAGGPKLSIDGQDQKIEGDVTCAAMGGNIQIALGNATGGLGAQISEGDAPVVHQVGLGNVGGVALGFQEGAPGGTATATKDGNTYKISGTATGVDMANPTQPVTKPFELEVTCP